jgi:hypothetical protein
MQVVLSVVGTSLEAADSSTKENPVWGLLSQTLDSFLFPTLKPHQVCPHFILGVTRSVSRSRNANVAQINKESSHFRKLDALL